MATAVTTILILAGVSGSPFIYINNHVYIALMYILYARQINDDSDDSDCGVETERG